MKNYFFIIIIYSILTSFSISEMVDMPPKKRPSMSMEKAVTIARDYFSKLLPKEEIKDFYPYEVFLVGDSGMSWYVSFIKNGGVRYRFRIDLNNEDNWYRVYPSFKEELESVIALPEKKKLLPWRE